MTPELEVGVTLAAGVRLAGVLGVVKHQHIRAGSLGRDDAGVLRHVSGSVHLALMIDLDLNLNFARHGSKSPELALFVVCNVRGY